MAAKKKSKRKAKAPGAKNLRARKRTGKKSASKVTRAKTQAKRQGAPAKIVKKTRALPKSRTRSKTQGRRSAFNDTKDPQTLSGDLQGVSAVESADSESVEELLEEGNTFEAEAVQGVEDADDADEKEVHTREFPEDDVPEEYLDKD